MADAGSMHGGQRRRAIPGLFASMIAIGALVALAPIFAAAVRAMLVWNGAWPHPSLSNLAALLVDPRFGGALLNSLIAGICTTVLSLIGGVTLAFLVTRTDMPGRRWLARLNLLPFFLSPYGGALAWIWLLAPHDGMLITWTRASHGISLDWLEIYSVPGVIFVLTLFHIPYAYLLAVPPLRDMDAALEDTARVHGATFWYTMRHITLPTLLPALSASAAIVFFASIGLLDVPLALGLSRGIPFIPTEIFEMAQRPSDLGLAAAFAGLLVLGGVALTSWLRRTRDPRFVPAPADRGYRPRPIRLGWPAGLAALGVEALYLGGGVLLPLLSLAMVSLMRIWNGRFAWRAATLVNYDAILWRDDAIRAAIGNSLTVAVCGATIGVALAAAQAISRQLDPSRAGRFARAAVVGSGGIPAICFGLGFLILTSRTRLYGTIGLVVIACVARSLPFVIRKLDNDLRAVGSGPREMARVAGAGRGRIARDILLPSLRPSLIAAWLLLFVLFIRELGATIMVYGQGSETIAVAMAMRGDASPGRAAALAMVQSVLLLVGFAAYNLIRAPLRFSPE